MKNSTRILLFCAATVFLLMGVLAWLIYPHENPQPLPERLVSANSNEGVSRLKRTQFKTDYAALAESYVAQALTSYCGVATGVAVLGALGMPSDQRAFFTTEASEVRSNIFVVFGGMSLANLAGLLRSHGLEADLQYAKQADPDEFRAVLRRNLANADDYVVVNYQREVLGQGAVGHISPIAAYDALSDSALVLDTAAHKYPPTWVPVDLLFSAMDTIDNASGRTRGYLEVRR